MLELLVDELVERAADELHLQVGAPARLKVRDTVVDSLITVRPVPRPGFNMALRSLIRDADEDIDTNSPRYSTHLTRGGRRFHVHGTASMMVVRPVDEAHVDEELRGPDVTDLPLRA